jgi:hypothetical protein
VADLFRNAPLLRLRAIDEEATREQCDTEPETKHHLAQIKLAQGDPVAAQRLLEQIPLDFIPVPYIWETRFKAALYLRDYDAASQVIAMLPPKWASDVSVFDGPSD